MLKHWHTRTGAELPLLKRLEVQDLKVKRLLEIERAAIIARRDAQLEMIALRRLANDHHK
jgi:hypothetical protein